jgi:hypothetical protein
VNVGSRFIKNLNLSSSVISYIKNFIESDASVYSRLAQQWRAKNDYNSIVQPPGSAELYPKASAKITYKIES